MKAARARGRVGARADAHRDFQNQPFNQDATGTTNAFSVGAYGTLIHPSGFYADLVVKYTQLWNDFDAPNVLSSLGLGPSATTNYSIPTFGGSLEIGKRWDFGHFFLEPQGQIEGAWADSTTYTVSTSLRVNADSQTSLREDGSDSALDTILTGLKGF